MAARIPARLSPAEGRKFGLTVGIAFLILGSVLRFWRHKETAGAVLGGLGALLVREQNGSFWSNPESGGRSDMERQF